MAADDRPVTEPLAVDNPYELLVQSVVDYAIYLLDRHGRVTSWNTGAERIKGYAADEVIGSSFARFYTPEDQTEDLPARALSEAASTGRFSTEGWRVRKDGTRFWALVVIDAVRNEAGEVIGFAKITRDISDRHEAQLRALESERRFRLLVQGVTDYAIYLIDPEGHVANWNAGAERIKGYTAEEIVGEPFARFYTPEDRAAGVPTTALETARREGRYEAEGWRVRKDGSHFWAMVVIDAIRDEDGELIGFAKITRDMTERREALARLEESREQLFQSQKMEALGQLTGGLAHDFNNLLAGVLGAAEIGLRHLDSPEKLRRMLEGIRSSAERGAGLTRQLLAFSSRQPLEPKVIDLADQLPRTAQLLGHSLRDDIVLETDLPDDLWAVEADAGQLELSLLNLGLNARDAMPDGGTVRLSARNVVLSNEVDGLQGDHVAISVADTGAGIPEEIRGRIFEPFFTTKKFGGGTGLGLAQVYGFARQSKGAVTVQSEAGCGATLTLYLPSRGVAAGRRVGDHSSHRDGRPRVLVVEDDPFLAELAAEYIDELGYEAKVTHNAADALAALSRVSGIRLVFSDVVMPGGMSGVELARKIRARYPELPILLTTGYSQVAGGPSDEFPVLAKPYDGARLAASISGLAALPQALQPGHR